MSAVVVPFDRGDAPVAPGADQKPACADLNPDWWFIESQFSQGQKVCRGCAIRERCLDEALANGEKVGVWGGLTPRQRAALPDAVIVPFRRRRGR